MKKKILIISSLLIVIIIIVSFFVLHKNNDRVEKLVFFFPTEDEKYLLYDMEGNRLSDIYYDNVLDYILSSTLIYKDSKVSVIDKVGNILVSEDDYDEIVRYAAFYKATKNDKTYLLGNNGKVIKEISEDKVASFKGAENFIIVENDDTYEIILYNGKIIYEFKRKEDILPTVSQKDDLASVFYNDLTIIFDINRGNIKEKIKGNIHYCINDINEDLIILNSCTNSFQERLEYKIIKDKKILDYKDICDTLSLSGNNIICESKNKRYLLDSDLKPSLEINSNINYIDYKNYIKEVDNKIEFYKDSNKSKIIDNAKLSSIGYQRDDYYILNVDNIYYYYDKSGDRVIKEGFKTANNFDTNSLALVGNGEIEYLIDKNGKRVVDDTKSIIAYSDFYIMISDRVGLLDKFGKVILNADYDNINLVANNDHNYAILTKDNSYIMYDIDNSIEIGSYGSKIEVFNNYYKVENKYYTYNGKCIYETK